MNCCLLLLDGLLQLLIEVLTWKRPIKKTKKNKKEANVKIIIKPYRYRKGSSAKTKKAKVGRLTLITKQLVF
jgi:hypothetical protein